ncbi:MAG: outer membrane beta-barrel protein [Candidatus Eisenbacteria bacterium]|nr:outer membrane beta-barrel protein [Candidatus Eisenbacteria bacterium]
MTTTSRAALFRAFAKRIAPAILPLLLLPAAAAAQDTPEAAPLRGGGVIGRVVSSETGDPIPFVDVVLFRPDPANPAVETAVANRMTNADGGYRIPARPGLYRLQVSHISFGTTDVTEVRVGENEILTLNVSLTPKAVRAQAVRVTADAIQGTETAILSRQKKAAAVSDGVSAEQIKRTPDSDAAEVLHRVTGLSVVNDRYVFVRGLGERYNSTKVNGNTIGTPEPNKRVVPLDLFPSSMLDNVIVQKTFTPDQPGEFGGGVVDVNTRDFPGRRTWSLSLSSGYREGTTGSGFLTYDGGKYDWLGFSGGKRALPDLVEELASDKLIKGGTSILHPSEFTDEEFIALGRSFENTWSPRTEDASPAYNFSGSYGDEILFLGRPLGFIGSASLRNGFTTKQYQSRLYEGGAGNLNRRLDLEGEASTASVLWGSMLNANYRFGLAHTLHLRTMYNRSAEDEVNVYDGEDTSLSVPKKSTQLRFVERGLWTTSVGMDHTLPGWRKDSRLHWEAGYSYAERNEPDRRTYLYEERVPPGDSVATWMYVGRTNAQELTRLFSYMDENERDYKLDWTFPFDQWGGLESKFKIGWSHMNKDRESWTRRFNYNKPSQTGDYDFTTDPEMLLADENIGLVRERNKWHIEEETEATDRYQAHHDLDAAYWMVDMPVHRRVRLVTGIRWEWSDQKAVTREPLIATAKDNVAELKTADALPSVNCTYTPHRDVNLRLAYSKTLNRPDLRELTPFTMVDFMTYGLRTGNPELERAILHNYDFRFEFYPGYTELLAFSAFHKEMKDPIEESVIGGENPVFIPENGEDGRLTGVELEARFSLGRIASPLRNLGLYSNYTRVNSETKTGRLGVANNKERPLQGQSDYVVNLGLFYSSPKGVTNASILYNLFGKRLAQVGLYEMPDVYETPRHSLDFTFSRAFLGGAHLKVAIENLLDDDVRFELDGDIEDPITYSAKSGRKISLSLSYGS